MNKTKTPPLEWHTEKRKVKDLIQHEGNPRIISDKGLSDLQKSFKKSGYVEPIVIDLNGDIVAGNQRHRAMTEMGMAETEIDVRVPNRKLTKKEFDRYLIASNALGGDWDIEKLKSFDISTLLDIGFDGSELATIWDQALEIEDDGFDVEAEIKKITKPKAKLGDIYALGPHRLACADSLDPKTIAALVGKARIDMIYCDPIYNLRMKGLYDKGIGGKANYGGTVNDSKTDEEYKTFLRKAMANALSVAKPDCHAFFWCDQNYIGVVQGLFTELGLTNRRVCLWVKQVANPVPGVAFNKTYEPVVYGTRNKPYLSPVAFNFAEILNKDMGPSGNKLLDDIMDTFDLWLAKRVSGTEIEHATQKPVTLHERPIKRCTKPGDTILDLFGGSGSTLIAADAMKRVCYMSEIEPLFIDLIIKRYEHATKIKARKIN
jgi:DNA modification methylase